MSAKTGLGFETWRNARRLAGRELRRSCRSFLWTTVFTAVAALFASTLVYGFYEVEELTDFFVDMFFLLVCANLSLNWAAVDYLQPGADLLSKRLRFLKSLPIAAWDLAVSRAAVIVVTLAIVAPVFFLVLYLISGELRTELGPAGYVSFVGIWSGYALLMGALEMYLEWSFSGDRLFAFQLVWIVTLIAAALAAELLGWPVFGITVDLAEVYGFVPAVVTLLVGGLALAFSVRTTARRLARRDLSA